MATVVDAKSCACDEMWKKRNEATQWCDAKMVHTHGDWEYTAMAEFDNGTWVHMNASYSVDKLLEFLGNWQLKKDVARLMAHATRSSWTRAEPRVRCGAVSLLVAYACGKCRCARRSRLLDDSRLETTFEYRKMTYKCVCDDDDAHIVESFAPVESPAVVVTKAEQAPDPERLL